MSDGLPDPDVAAPTPQALLPVTDASKTASEVPAGENSTKASGDGPSRKNSKQTAHILKKIAWRATASYAWINAFFSLMFDHSVGASLHLSTRLAALLSSFGFAPLDPRSLAKVFWTAWILVISAFRPIEIIALTIYVIVFPIVPLGIYLASGTKPKDTSETNKKLGLGPIKQRRIALPLCAVLLLSWFVLFGDTNSRRPAIVGTALAGILFLLLAVRAFQRVRPSYEPDPNFLRVPKILGLSFLQTAAEQLPKIKTKNEAIVSQRTYVLFRKLYRCLALWTRGRRAKNRVYLFVLAEYVASLVLLAGSAILFWAMADKVFVIASDFPLSRLISINASMFFPTLPAIGLPTTLPKILLVGPSISAWVLFVLYVGPASTILASRQDAYAKSITTAHAIFRKFTFGYGAHVRFMKLLAKKLP